MLPTIQSSVMDIILYYLHYVYRRYVVLLFQT